MIKLIARLELTIEALFPMMPPHKDFPSDNLMCWSVMDGGVPGKFLTALWTLKVAPSMVFRYHASIALDKFPAAFFFIAVKQARASTTVHRNGICFHRGALLE